MKNNMKPSFYYSAYPLKAIEQAVVAAKNGEPSPKLRALLSAEDTKPKAVFVFTPWPIRIKVC